jgi:hypothetical protein
MKSKQDDPFHLRGSLFTRIYWGVFTLFLIGLSMVFISLGVQANDFGPILFLLGFLGVMALFPMIAVYRTFTWLYIYRDGILIHRPFRPRQFLEWKAITQVRSNLWGRTIVVSDAAGNIKARVYSSLTNSQYFVGWLMEARPDIWAPEEGLTFRKSSLFSLFFLFGAVMSVILALSVGDFTDWGVWFAFVMGAGCVIVVLFLPQSFMVGGDYLHLRFPFRTKVIHAQEITGISLVPALVGYIEIKLRKGPDMALMFFSLGLDMLFGFLWFWHASRTRKKLTGGPHVPARLHVPRRLTTLPLLPPTDTPDR